MDGFLNSHRWGGSGIERVTFEEILKLIPKGSEVIELGAGKCSTLAFSQVYKLTSIEHNLEWCNLYPNVNYIHAPLVNGWYDLKVLKGRLPAKNKQKLIFIDGSNREGILKNLHLFNKKATFMVHDTYRPAEHEFSIKLAKALGREVRFFNTGDYFSII